MQHPLERVKKVNFLCRALNGSFVETLIFEEGCKQIPYSAAEGAVHLKEVVIPASVTKIDTNAFGDCTALTQINIPDSVQTIGENLIWNAVE